MARQTGLIKLKGTLDNVNFYKSKDGNMARMKTSVDASRIKNDPAFIRTRENGAEFGGAASEEKIHRDALRVMMQNTADGRVTARLTKIMTQIKNMDVTSPRGERSVGIGIADPAAKTLLKGFNFNNRSILGSVLFKGYTVDTATGEIEILGLTPINDIAFPTGATHVSLRGAFAKIDFAGEVSDVEETNIANLPLDATTSTVNLIPAATPSGTGTSLYLLMLEFFQEVNGVQYSLKNGAFNVMNIIEAQ